VRIERDTEAREPFRQAVDGYEKRPLQRSGQSS